MGDRSSLWKLLSLNPQSVIWWWVLVSVRRASVWENKLDNEQRQTGTHRSLSDTYLTIQPAENNGHCFTSTFQTSGMLTLIHTTQPSHANLVSL